MQGVVMVFGLLFGCVAMTAVWSWTQVCILPCLICSYGRRRCALHAGVAHGLSKVS